MTQRDSGAPKRSCRFPKLASGANVAVRGLGERWDAFPCWCWRGQSPSRGRVATLREIWGCACILVGLWVRLGCGPTIWGETPARNLWPVAIIPKFLGMISPAPTLIYGFRHAARYDAVAYRASAAVGNCAIGRRIGGCCAGSVSRSGRGPVIA